MAIAGYVKHGVTGLLALLMTPPKNKFLPLIILFSYWFTADAISAELDQASPTTAESVLMVQQSNFQPILIDGPSFTLASPDREFDRPSFEFAKPDLVAWSLDIDNYSYIVFTIRNFGASFSPGSAANYRIYVDGQLVEEHPLVQIPNQNFRQKSGYTRHTSSVRIGGANRRVALIVDPDNNIDEIRKDQNSVYATLSSPITLSPADLAITDLSATRHSRSRNNTLRISIANKGGRSSKPDTQFLFSVVINEGQPQVIPATVPALNPGQTTVVDLGGTVVLPKRAMVNVSMKPAGRTNDFDNTNNSRREELPLNMSAYNNLLSNPKISKAIIWHKGGIKISYPGWTDDQKGQLEDAVRRRESGDSPLLNGPPATLSEGLSSANLSHDDAWKIFLAFIAQNLWVEKYDIVPWSLTDLSDYELRLLLDSSLMFWPSERSALADWQFPMDEVTFHARLHGGSFGDITAWNPTIGYEFMTNSEMLRASQKETLYALTSWMQARLNHTQPWHGDQEGTFKGPIDREAEWGYPGRPLVDTILYPLPKRSHRISGCNANTGLYSYLLRSLNIPVEHAAIGISIPELDGSYLMGGHNHNRPIFPSVGKTMVHSDDPYTLWFTPQINPLPPKEIFHDFPQVSAYEEKIWGPFNPLLDLDPNNNHATIDGTCKSDICSEKYSQATYFYMQDALRKNHQYNAGALLQTYMKHGPTGVRETLTGRYVKPYFTETEQDLMISEIEQQLREIGDGDLDKGLELLAYQFDLFRRTQDTAAYVRSSGSKITVWMHFEPNGNGDRSPLPDVTVVAYEVGNDGVFGNGDDREAGRAISDEAGKVFIRDLEDGTYVLDIVDETIPVNCQPGPSPVSTFSSDPSGPITLGFPDFYGSIGWVFHGACQ